MRTYFMVYDFNGHMRVACPDCVERLLPPAMYVETLFTLDDIEHIHLPSKPMTPPAKRN